MPAASEELEKDSPMSDWLISPSGKVLSEFSSLLLGIANPSQNKAELQVSMILHIRGHQWLTRQDFGIFFILPLYKHISYFPVTLGFLVTKKKVSLSVSHLLIYKTLLFPLFISFPVSAVQLTEFSLHSAPLNVLICHCASSVSTR